MEARQDSYRLLCDLPCNLDDDALGYQKFADELNSLIINSAYATPLTIGIEGEWGAGKSSLMRMLQQRLKGSGMHTIWFNAWSCESADVTEGLIKTILRGLEDDFLMRRMLWRRKAEKMAVPALQGLIKVSGAYFGIGRVVDQIWQAFSSDAQVASQFEKLFAETMRDWTKRRKQKKLVIVFIDDLDRCEAGKVLQVLDGVKLYVSVQGMVFVIGYARDRMVGRIGPEIAASQNQSVKEYLEKIIQVPFTIPPPDNERLMKYLNQCARRCRAELACEGLHDIIINRNEHNPRRIKLFMNTFATRYSMCGLNNSCDTHEDFSRVLCMVLLMELYFDRFYRRHLRRDPDRIMTLVDFLNISDALKRQEKGFFKDLPSEIQEALKRSERGEVQFGREDSLEELREKVSDGFPEDSRSFAQDSVLFDLVSKLADELRGGDQNEKKKLLQRVVSSEWADINRERRTREAFAEKLGSRTARILWVSEHKADIEWVTGRMIPYRITNVIVENTEKALLELRKLPFDILITNISRGDDHDAGFKLVDEIQSKPEENEGTREKPMKVIFYTKRVTPKRRNTAKELGAPITSDPDELVEFIQLALDLPKDEPAKPVVPSLPA